MLFDRLYPFSLLPLEYEEDRFDPSFFSKEVFQFHRGKHHLGYIAKLNALLESNYEELQFLTLKKLVLQTRHIPEVFNNAGQTLNHDLFWASISPDKQTGQGTKLMEAISLQYGSWQNFVERFVEESMKCFGSGWTWLCSRDGKLEISATSNADSPIAEKTPIFTCDLWEHAYYITFRNDRAAYVKRMVNEFLNWRELEGTYLKSM